ncbi:hypothetical protein WN943_029499 [Citrus x changshan-huyou]
MENNNLNVTMRKFKEVIRCATGPEEARIKLMGTPSEANLLGVTMFFNFLNCYAKSEPKVTPIQKHSPSSPQNDLPSCVENNYIPHVGSGNTTTRS